MYKGKAGLVSIWLLASLAACGPVTAPDTADAGINTSIDARPADASADASAPDAQTHGTITVRVMIDGNPAVGIPVFSHDVDGTYIASVLTNAVGEVSIDDFPAGGAITAPVAPFINGFNGENQITSITGVQLGDVLTLGNSEIFPSEASAPKLGDATITPPATAVGGATRYRVYIPCRGSSTSTVGTSLTIPMNEGCVRANNTIDAIAVAEDSTGARLAYTTRQAIPVTGVAPNMVASATLNGWSTDWARLQLNLQNAPFDQLDPEGLVLGFRDGLNLDDQNFPDLSQPLNMGGGGTFSTGLVPNFNNDTAYLVAIQGSQGISIVSTREQLPLSPNTSHARSVDLSADLLPVIESTVVGNVNDPSVTWTTLSDDLKCKGNPSLDSIVTMVRAETTADEYLWFVLSQGSASQGVTYPKLDPALAVQLWPSATFVDVQGGVALFSDNARTYDEIRTTDNNMTFFDFVPTADSSRCLTTSGTLLLN